MPGTNGSSAQTDRRGGKSNIAPILDWEGTRIFLGVARAGSLRAASTALHLSVNSLRRKLDSLERGLGATLVTRHIDGVRLTVEGERIRDAAERMEAASFDVLRRCDDPDKAMSGKIRLAATEGLGTYWIAPRIQDFQRLYPHVSVDLRCDMAAVDVLRLEADVAVQYDRPVAKDLKLVKLGRMHIMPFATVEYLEQFGTPKCIADLDDHRLIALIAAQVKSVEEFIRNTERAYQINRIVLRTNGSNTNYRAILRGAGIGWLPTYSAMDERLVPLDYGDRHAFDIWLVYHPDAARIARVRELISWLVDSFSPQKFPFFGDKFVHPREFRGNALASRRRSKAVDVEGPRLWRRNQD